MAKKAVVKQSPGHVQMTDAQAKFFEYNVRKEEAERIRVFLGTREAVKPSPIVSARDGPDLMTMPKAEYHDLLRSTKDLKPEPSAVYAARATAASPPADRAGSPGVAVDSARAGRPGTGSSVAASTARSVLSTARSTVSIGRPASQASFGSASTATREELSALRARNMALEMKLRDAEALLSASGR